MRRSCFIHWKQVCTSKKPVFFSTKTISRWLHRQDHYDNVIWFHSSLKKKTTNIPTLGHRFFVKFLRMEKAIRLKCLTYAMSLPPPSTLRLNIE